MSQIGDRKVRLHVIEMRDEAEDVILGQERVEARGIENLEFHVSGSVKDSSGGILRVRSCQEGDCLGWIAT